MQSEGYHHHYSPRTPLPDIKWSDRLGEPTGHITREVFVKRARNFLKNFVEDHEAMTGVTSDEKMRFEDWCQELTNAHDNTF